MSINPSLYDGYIGPNSAHMAFKREIVNAKVLLFQIYGNRQQLKASFQEKISDARKKALGSFTVGMVTEVLSQTQFRALNIPHNEADLVVAEYDSLETQFYALMYIDLQRILESFLLDLYAEVARKDQRVLMSNKTVTFEEVLKTNNMLELLLEKQITALSRSDRDGFEKEFQNMSLPIVPLDGRPEDEQAFLVEEFSLLWAVRNVLQHNHGIVNAVFLKKIRGSNYKVGDRLAIDVPKLGRALAAAESIGDDLNRRAVVKYALA